MSVVLDKINEMFLAGHRHKEKARKSLEALDDYATAASCYYQAADLARAATGDSNLAPDIVLELKVFASYYQYEAAYCLKSFYYEKHESDLAWKHYTEAQDALRRHLDELDEAMEQVCLDQSRARLDLARRKGEFFEGMLRVDGMALKARRAWDSEEFVAAIDLYRRMADELGGLALVGESLPEPAYGRIARGNYIGAMCNTSGAMAKIYQQRTANQLQASQDMRSTILAFLEHNLRALQLGRQAFDANPEWAQFLDNAKLCEENAAGIVHLFKSDWPSFFTALGTDPDLRRLMALEDLRAFQALDRGSVAVGTPTLLAREGLLKKISLALDLLQCHIKSMSSLRLLDAHVVSEDFFAHFLSVLHERSFVNLNDGPLSQAAIDLGDRAMRIAVQVTSDGSKAKVRETLRKFREHKLDQYYDKLEIVIIGKKKRGKYADLDSVSAPTFESANDIHDIPWLLQKIATQDVAKLRELSDIIDREMPVVASTPVLRIEQSTILGGSGTVGDGGDARVRVSQGTSVQVSECTIRAGDGGDGGGKGGDAVIEAGNG